RLPLSLRIVACAVFAFTLAQMAVAQQVYRWVDENGIVHYSDTPPPEKKDLERVNVRTTGAAKLTAEELAAAETAEKARPESAQAAKRAEAEAKKEQNCKSARSSLLALNSGSEVSGDFDGVLR